MTDSPAPLAIPVLYTGDITLRPHAADDADAVWERSVDPETQRFTTIPSEYTRAMAEEYVTVRTAPSPTQICWAIELDGRYAGSIDLRTYGHGPGYGAGALGFVTSPWARGRGVMTSAVGLVMDHALELGLETLVWQARVGNVGSWKAVWRNGFHSLVEVPALLPEPDGIVDGWHAVYRRGDPRVPAGSWEDAIPASAREG